MQGQPYRIKTILEQYDARKETSLAFKDCPRVIVILLVYRLEHMILPWLQHTWVALVTTPAT